MEQNSQRHKYQIILAFFMIYVIWGSTYLFNKMLVQELPPFLLAGVRFTIASILIFGVAYLRGNLKAITTKQVVNSVIAGALFLTVGNGCAVWALQYVDSGFSALIISAQPLILILMMYVLEGKSIKWSSMMGVALGILGIYLLVQQPDEIALQDKLKGVAALFVALLAWGYGSMFVAKADLPAGHFVKTGYQMLFGGIMLFGLALANGESYDDLIHLSSVGWWSMTYLVVFGSIVAFTSFNFLLVHVSPEKVATSTYVNPVVAMILGWWVLDEAITGMSVIAAVVLLTGVYFINSNRSFAAGRRARKKSQL